jgi:hypothetical protein
MIFNASVSETNNPPNLFIKSEKIKFVSKFKFLGSWLDNKQGSAEHVNMRIRAAINASYGLNTIGVDNPNMPLDMKLNLYVIYCRTTLLYCTANFYINKTLQDAIQTTELNILKRLINLPKTSKNTELRGALKLNSMRDQIIERKLALLNQLMNNDLTRKILEHQMENIEHISDRSLLAETIEKCGFSNDKFSLSLIKPLLEAHEAYLADAPTAILQSSEKLRSIRYLLENRSGPTDEALTRILIPAQLKEHKTRVFKHNQINYVPIRKRKTG